MKERWVSRPELQVMKHLQTISCKVSHWPFTVKAWVQSARGPHRKCGRLNDTGTHFSQVTSVFSGQDHSSNIPHPLIRHSSHYTPCPKKTTSVITVQRNFRRQFEVDPPILNLCKVEKNFDLLPNF
jgi:hypothetical protein